MGYRVPKEWGTVEEGQRRGGSLAAFKRGSRAGFLRGYGAFVCGGCYVCAGGEGQARGVGSQRVDQRRRRWQEVEWRCPHFVFYLAVINWFTSQSICSMN